MATLGTWSVAAAAAGALTWEGVAFEGVALGGRGRARAGAERGCRVSSKQRGDTALRPSQPPRVFPLSGERQCLGRPKPCPQMARTTTTSSRITGPSFLSGSTQCAGSGPTGTGTVAADGPSRYVTRRPGLLDCRVLCRWGEHGGFRGWIGLLPARGLPPSLPCMPSSRIPEGTQALHFLSFFPFSI